MSEFRTGTIALGVVLMLCATAFAGMCMVSDETDAGTQYVSTTGDCNTTYTLAQGDTIVVSHTFYDYDVPDGDWYLLDSNNHFVTTGFTASVSGTTYTLTNNSLPAGTYKFLGGCFNSDAELEGENETLCKINATSAPTVLTSLNYQMQMDGADAGTSWTIATGSYVNIKPFEDQGGSGEFGSYISSVTPSGSGLNSSGCGTLLKAGTYTLNGRWWNGTNGGNFTYTITAVGDEYFPHTVKYNANGGSGTIDDKVVYSPASGSVSVPIGDGSGFTKSGYKVIGWNTAANGSGTNYDLNSSVSVAKNGTVTLYAQWGVDEGNGSQSNPLSSINKNVTIKDKDATIYVRVGASVDLKGWGEEAEGISWHSGKGLGLTEYESGGFEYVAYGLHGTITQAGTLQTVWWVLCDPDGNYDSEFTLTIVAVASSYTHTVTYAANGGSGTTANTVVTDQTNGNSSVTLASNGFTKSGYHFVGWKVGNTVYQPGAKVSVGANATVTATAQWEANTLTLGSVAKQYAVAGHNVTFTVSAMSNPSGASISFAKSNVSNGLTVSISGNVVTCSASTPGTYTFTLTASATGYTSASTTVTVQVVPVLAFTNSPTAGALNA